MRRPFGGSAVMGRALAHKRWDRLMERELFTRHSSRLNRDMNVLSFGDGGYPLVVFPTQNAQCNQWEDFGMVDELAGLIRAHKIRLFCVDTVDSESWYGNAANKEWRADRQEAYYRYVCEELVPLVHEICGNDLRPIACGASLGATHAAIVTLRRPDLFEGCIALSGIYRTSYYFGEWMNSTLYDNDITAFLSNMEPTHPYVDLYNQRQLVFCVGQGAWEQDAVADLRVLSEEFDRLGVSAWCDFWGFDVSHDWPWWKKQMDYFVPIVLDDIQKQRETEDVEPTEGSKPAKLTEAEVEAKKATNLERCSKPGKDRSDECAVIKADEAEPPAHVVARESSKETATPKADKPKAQKSVATKTDKIKVPKPAKPKAEAPAKAIEKNSTKPATGTPAKRTTSQAKKSATATRSRAAAKAAKAGPRRHRA